MVDRIVRYRGEYNNETIFPLESRPAGIYEISMLIKGNSILSTVTITHMDAGASVLVKYVESTTTRAQDAGQLLFLEQQGPFTAADLPVANKISVTRIHSTPRCILEITGGSATVEVHNTVVLAFATDLDAALAFDNSPFFDDQDKAIPTAGLDESTNTIKFLRLDSDGKLLISGDLQLVQTLVNKSLVGIEPSPLSGVQYKLIDYTVPAGKRLVWLDGIGHSGTIALWRVEIDDVLFMLTGDNCTAKDERLSVQNSTVLTEGMNLKVYGTVTHPRAITAPLYATIYGNLN